MKKARVAICGHFGIGLTLLNGQTVKTVIVTDELESELGKGSVWRIDTHGRWKQFLMFPKLLWALLVCQSVIILPANDALLYEVPWIAFWNRFFKKKLFYVVIGGWLKEYLEGYPKIASQLKDYDGIFVETTKMKKDLEIVGFTNISVLPNCKPLKIVSKEDMVYSFTEPLPLVTFSRVMEEKGIGNLVHVVKAVNSELGRDAISLDIYGQVDENEKEWFERLKATFSTVIHYKGCVAFDKSAETLSKYFALVFPTRFYTEGVPGTIIDAYSAGLPVISSKWENFGDVIEEGVTGVGFEFENWDELKKLLISIVNNPAIIYQKKEACIRKAIEFAPEKVIPKLAKQLPVGGGKMLILSTFSRIMKQKGIEEAINAVADANHKIGRTAFHLIVYGQIEKEEKEWFEGLLSQKNPDAAWEYGGLVPFDRSTDTLKRCFALLFPTYYEGEGFAGTLIDAFASGVPVIASDWKYNAEIVENGKTGAIIRHHDKESLTDALIWAYEHQREWNYMKFNCLEEANKYVPKEAIKSLLKAITS